jgi:uncharacterized protein
MIFRLLFLITCLTPVSLSRVMGGERLFDEAGQIDSFTQVAINGLMADIEENTGVELVVVTRSGIGDLALQSEAVDLFAQLGFGRRYFLNAVLMLVDTEGARVEIVTGYGMGQFLTDAYLRSAIEEFMISPLESDEVGEAVFNGVEQLSDLLKRYPLAAQGRGEALPLAVSTPLMRAKLFAGFIKPFFVVGVVIAGWIYRRRFYPSVILYSVGIISLFFCSTYLGYFLEVNRGGEPWAVTAKVILFLVSLTAGHWFLYKRFGPHACLACGGRLELLSNIKDTDLIWETSFLEYTVSGRSKDVWFCSCCLKRKTERYVNSYLELRECPNCRAPALRETRRVVRASSLTSQGLERVEGACISCRYSFVSNESVPKIARTIPADSSQGDEARS